MTRLVRGRFEGAVYLVCGASSGLGQALAELILAEGGSVVAVARRASLPNAQDARLLRVQADLNTSAGVALVLEAVQQRGIHLDGVLMNGGGPPPGSALSVTATDWHAAVEALIVQPLALVRGLLGHLAPAGSFLFVTSSSAREPINELDVSNVLRPGVAALANILSRALAPNVRVNSIAPGRIDTPRLKAVQQTQAAGLEVSEHEHPQALYADIPLQRYGTPAEFAEAAAFLLSPAASYINGTAVQLDGGLLRGT